MDFVEDKMQRGEKILTVKQIVREFPQVHGQELKQHHVRDVMRNQAGLRYKKIVRLAPQTNSLRCLYLRQ